VRKAVGSRKGWRSLLFMNRRVSLMYPFLQMTLGGVIAYITAAWVGGQVDRADASERELSWEKRSHAKDLLRKSGQWIR
jgi:hypothetical protein